MTPNPGRIEGAVASRVVAERQNRISISYTSDFLHREFII
jgi:hypothetical protein